MTTALHSSLLSHSRAYACDLKSDAPSREALRPSQACQAKEGALADKTTSLILDALSRAVADPAGVPLHGKTASGLFTTTAAAKQAAQRCKDEGFLRIVRTETKGKTLHEICAI